MVTVGSATPEALNGLAHAKASLRDAGIMTETAILPGQPETARGKLVDEAAFDMLVMGPTAIRASAA